MTSTYDPIHLQRDTVVRCSDPFGLLADAERVADEHDPADGERLAFRYGFVTTYLLSVIRDLRTAINTLEYENHLLQQQNVELSNIASDAFRDEDFVAVGDRRFDTDDGDERIYEVLQIVRQPWKGDDLAIIQYEDDGEKVERDLYLVADDLLETRASGRRNA